MTDERKAEPLDLPKVDAAIAQALQSTSPWEDEAPPREEVMRALRASIVSNDMLYRELAK